MKKKLKLETLNVESFRTLSIESGRGTVHGASTTTVAANVCYPNSNIMDCWMENESKGLSCQCPVSL